MRDIISSSILNVPAELEVGLSKPDADIARGRGRSAVASTEPKLASTMLLQTSLHTCTNGSSMDTPMTLSTLPASSASDLSPSLPIRKPRAPDDESTVRSTKMDLTPEQSTLGQSSSLFRLQDNSLRSQESRLVDDESTVLTMGNLWTSSMQQRAETESHDGDQSTVLTKQ